MVVTAADARVAAVVPAAVIRGQAVDMAVVVVMVAGAATVGAAAAADPVTDRGNSRPDFPGRFALNRRFS